MRTVSRWLMLLGLLCGTVAAWADEERAYTDGAVLSVGYIRTKYGMFDEYMKYLAGPYKRLMEEQKEQGTIIEYTLFVDKDANKRMQGICDIYLEVMPTGPAETFRLKIDVPEFKSGAAPAAGPASA